MTSYIGKKPSDVPISVNDVPDLPTSKITSGTFADARISNSSVSQHAQSFDDNKIQTNLALLGFKTASVGSLATYNLQDQSIDEFTDGTGINSSSSTNANVNGGKISGGVSPNVTHDADTTGTDGAYSWYRWTDTSATGSYSQDSAQAVDFLVVAGGGPGGFAESGGGGGAGGLRTSYGSVSGGGASAESDLNLGSGTTYTITVGAGGAAPTAWSQHHGSKGADSSISGSDITDIVSAGGGVGNGYEYSAHTLDNGGSGGGQGDPSGGSNVGTGTANQGYNGGSAGTDTGTDSTQAGGGGGGAGGTGGNGQTGSGGYGGTGGVGLNIDITGTSVGYAGGGGGAHTPNGSTASHGGGKGGLGGGGHADGTDGTGGGGGASYVSGGSGAPVGRGGHGVVILRRLTNPSVSNMTAISNSVTAQSVPTKSDFVMLMENETGTATINTDIKAYVSRDNGSTFTQGTLVDEGTYATNTKILAFHDLDISSQPSGSNMVYKIETLNQANGVKSTSVKATSLGWK